MTLNDLIVILEWPFSWATIRCITDALFLCDVELLVMVDYT